MVVYSVTGFSGYALLLPVAPLWAVHGGAGAAGAGLVNGVLLATTVVAQLAVPWTLRTLGHGGTMALGLVLMAAGEPRSSPTRSPGSSPARSSAASASASSP